MRLTRKRTEQDVLAFIMERGNVCMSQRTISEQIGYSSSTIARTLDSLEGQGLIKVIKPDITSKPSSITYTGPKKVRKSTTEAINSATIVLRDILNLVNTKEKMHPFDKEPSEHIDVSKVILLKKLPNVQAYMLIIKA